MTRIQYKVLDKRIEFFYMSDQALLSKIRLENLSHFLNTILTKKIIEIEKLNFKSLTYAMYYELQI